MVYKRNRFLYLVMIVVVIILGLGSRKLVSVLPAFLNIYLGDALWALMIFLGFGFIFRDLRTKIIALIGISFCYLIELSQLYNANWIESIRKTTLGGLILGFVFSWSDLLAYAIGTSVGISIDILLGVIRGRSKQDSRGNKMKKVWIFLLGSILLVIVLITSFIYIEVNKPYTEIINLNWSIKLPETYKKIYSTDSGSNFFGEGVRYSIFEYNSIEDINTSLNWNNNENKVVDSGIKKVQQTEIKEVINDLNIPIENMPDFKSKYKYYTKLKADSSKIYLIFVTDTKKLYIIENIY